MGQDVLRHRRKEKKKKGKKEGAGEWQLFEHFETIGLEGFDECQARHFYFSIGDAFSES